MKYVSSRAYLSLVLLAGLLLLSVGCGHVWGSLNSVTPPGSQIIVAVQSTADHIVIIQGDGQTAAVTNNVNFNPTVQVQDVNNNGVSNVTVSFTVTSNGGSVANTSVNTDSNGFASTSFAVGTTAGSDLYTMDVTTAIITLPGSPPVVTFTESAVAGPPDHLIPVAGQNQTAFVSSAVSVLPQVLVVDFFNNPISGYNVSFSPLTGGGSVGSPLVSTNANGAAGTTYTIGPAAGANTMQAAGSPALPGSPTTVTFSETGSAVGSVPDHIIVIAGDGQSGSKNAALTTSPEVQVVDAGGLPVPGVVMTFTVLGGGGSVGAATVTTNSQGYASVSYTLGPVPGVNNNTMQVAKQGAPLPGAPSTWTFTETATNTGTIPDHIIYITGTGQSVNAGQVLPINPQIQVVDASGLPVAGVTMQVTVLAGAGTPSIATGTTDADGYLTFSYLLGTTAGANTFKVSKQGVALPGVPATYTFSETGTVGSPAELIFSTIASQFVVNACSNIGVSVADAFGNITTATSAITINLSSSTGHSLFYATNGNCTTNTAPLTTRTIGLGASNTGNFSWKNTASEDFLVYGSDGAGILGSGISEVLAELRIKISNPASISAGACQAYTLTTTDNAGNPLGVVGSDTTTLISHSRASFYSDNACTVPTTSVAWTSGQSSLSGLYYMDQKAQATTPSTTHTNPLVNLSNMLGAPITTTPITPTSIAITGPTFADTGSCTAYTVTTLDPYLNVGVPGVAPTVNISATNGASVFTNVGCTIPGPLTFGGGASSATFYLKDAAATATTLTVDGTGASLGTATFNATIQAAPVGRVTQVVAGLNHSCALVGGGVKCWGDNSYGELGNNSLVSSMTPVTPLGLGSGVSAIGAGVNFTCALLASGNVECWGYNNTGQLGLTNPLSSCASSTGAAGLYCQLVPKPVSNLGGGITQIAVGGLSTCALSGGSVFCWGQGSFGEMGNNLTANEYAAVQVKDPTGTTTLSGVTDIGASSYTMCAVVGGGAAYCWGYAYQGALGNGASSGSYKLPIQPTGLAAGVSKIRGGYSYNCALMTSGQVLCWGIAGTIGNSSGNKQTTPTQPTGLGAGSVSDIGTSYNTTCVILSGGGGNVECWGVNTYGEVGNGTTTALNSPSATILSGVGSLTSGSASYTICALLNSGNVQCWGENNYGGLGNSSISDMLSPVSIDSFQ